MRECTALGAPAHHWPPPAGLSVQLLFFPNTIKAEDLEDEEEDAAAKGPQLPKVGGRGCRGGRRERSS